MRTRWLGWTVPLALLLTFDPVSAFGQSQPAPTQAEQKPKPKFKFVWTEDSIAYLRRPWDFYQIAQEKKAEEERVARAAAAEAAKKGAAVKAPETETSPAPATEGGSQIPETVPALERRIVEVRYTVEKLEREYEQAEKAAYDSREDERVAAEEHRRAVADELDKVRTELRLLEDKLRSLKSRQSNETPSP